MEGQNKRDIGVIMALFLGLIGLIIGLLLYPAGSYERATFLNGWIKTYVICLIIVIVLVVGIVGCASCMAFAYV